MRRSLVGHPGNPARAVRAVSVDVEHSPASGFALRFMVEGEIDRILLPRGEGALAVADRGTDGLWQSSCFELFLADEGHPRYTEFNYAPDGRWACYHFDDYRTLLAPDDMLAPRAMSAEREAAHYAFRVEPGILPAERTKLALSAVIEETDGTKSYWALCHPPGKPDFHHPDCFALALGAPDGA